jgi:nucleoside-diphosphate-sugar epimerase
MALRIVVTGSEGFVGKHLRRALLARGCEVIGVDRPGTGAEIERDLSEPDLDAARIAERAGSVAGVIYMAATITRGSSVDAPARANLRAIADAAVEFLEAFGRSSPGSHFVYCSTYKTYGPAEAAIDPERPPQRPDPHSYGSAKSLAERLLAIAAARMALRHAVVRPTCIYGPGQHLHNAIPRFLRAVLDGQSPVVYGMGAEVRDDVFAPDLAYCLAEACLRRSDGAFHAAGERARTVFEVAELCCEAVERAGGMKGVRPVRDPSKPAKWWLDQSFALERSRRLLGYEPTPLIDGLICEAQWLGQGAPPGRSVDFCPEPRLGVR